MNHYKKKPRNEKPEYNWADLLEVCNDLDELYKEPKYIQDDSKSEALSRSIVNRVYYACYSKTSINLQKKNGYEFQKDGRNSGHQKLLESLNAMTEKGIENDKFYITEQIERKRYIRIKESLTVICNHRGLVDYKTYCLNNHLYLASESLMLGKYIFMLFDCLENNLEFDHNKEEAPPIIKNVIANKKQ